MAIRLDRTYTENALMEDMAFSTPHFLTMLIENGYLADDELEILRDSVIVQQDNLNVLTEVINGQKRYRLPVVYVAKTIYNGDPVNVRWLCSKLKGVAHVLVEGDKSLNYQIRTVCDDNNEYNGSIGVYFPNGSHRRFLYRSYTGSSKILLEKVARSVFQYVNVQKIPMLYTWQGVNNSLLTDRLISQREERQAAENARQKAESEVEEFLGAFDDDLSRLQKQIAELSRANNYSLRLEWEETRQP